MYCAGRYYDVANTLQPIAGDRHTHLQKDTADLLKIRHFKFFSMLSLFFGKGSQIYMFYMECMRTHGWIWIIIRQKLEHNLCRILEHILW